MGLEQMPGPATSSGASQNRLGRGLNPGGSEPRNCVLYRYAVALPTARLCVASAAEILIPWLLVTWHRR